MAAKKTPRSKTPTTPKPTPDVTVKVDAKLKKTYDALVAVIGRSSRSFSGAIRRWTSPDLRVPVEIGFAGNHARVLVGDAPCGRRCPRAVPATLATSCSPGKRGRDRAARGAHSPFAS